MYYSIRDVDTGETVSIRRRNLAMLFAKADTVYGANGMDTTRDFEIVDDAGVSVPRSAIPRRKIK